MAQQQETENRPPFAAYGPASAGYGLRRPAPTSPLPPSDGRRPDRSPSNWPGGTALVLAVLGTLLALIPWLNFFAWMPLLLAIVLSIVQVARRGAARVVGTVSLVVAVFGLVGLVLSMMLWAGAFRSDPAEPSWSADEPWTAPPVDRDLGTLTAPVTDGAPLPWGAAALLSDADGAAVWSVAVDPPVDATALALERGAAPLSGSVVVVPVRMTNSTDAAIDLATWRGDFTTDLTLVDGSRPPRLYVDGLQDVYPERWSFSVVAPGETVVYYDVWDASLEQAAAGVGDALLFGSAQSLTWAGPLP